jgi:hypothetical protein
MNGREAKSEDVDALRTKRTGGPFDEQHPHVIPAQLSLASGSTMQQMTIMSHFVYIKLFCVALYIFCMARISLAGCVYSVVHTLRLERERSNEAQNFPVHFDTFLLAWTSDSPWH